MPRTIDAVDKVVGRNVRVYRLAKGLSQTALGAELGVTFQQVQKYESGANRIGSGRLHRIAQILDVGIGALFEGSGVREKASTATLYEELANPYSLRLIQAFSEIDNQRVRRSLVEFVETMAKAK
jgi:transcriptional regulator with XRE-family HTH domain